jgi:hypothetical protein
MISKTVRCSPLISEPDQFARRKKSFNETRGFSPLHSGNADPDAPATPAG